MPDTAPPSRSRTRHVLASESRLRLLDILAAAGRGMHAGELAVECGLHVSTVRFHLDELRGAGLVRAHTEAPGGRGRPRQLFVPVSSAVVAWVPNADPKTFSGYEQLARALAASVAAGDDPAAAMERAQFAGRRWAGELVSSSHPTPAGHEMSGVKDSYRSRQTGRRDVDSSAPDSAEPAHAAAARVNGLFAGLGFDPEMQVGPGSAELLLHACPFDAVVNENPAVACSLHLGLLEGTLDQLGSGSVSAELEGPISGRPCVARLTSPANQ